MRRMRVISWIGAARKEFERFPAEVRIDAGTALGIAAEGGKADIAKSLKGLDGGVFEIVLRHRVTRSAWSTLSGSEPTYGCCTRSRRNRRRESRHLGERSISCAIGSGD